VTSIEEYVKWVMARLAGSPREEPDLEFKSAYPPGTEAEQVWELADLIAALSNDPSVEGYRAIVFGPVSGLVRPAWLVDEAVLRGKFLRYFEGGVLPRIELLRRQMPNGDEVDLLIIADRSETPYVTRSALGGEWVVRVRTNTARRTATRAEIVALVGGVKPTGGPVRLLSLRLEPYGKGTSKIVVSNVGTIPVLQIELRLPPDSQIQRFGSDAAIQELRSGEQGAFPILDPGGFLGADEPKAERVEVVGVAEDGETVTSSLLVSPW